MKYRFLAFVSLILFSIFLYQHNDRAYVLNAFTDVPTEVLSQLVGAEAASQDHELTLEKMLLYAMQDEYRAQSTYQLTIEKFGDQKPFSSILRSEEQHIRLLTALFAKYNLELPTDTRVYSFIEPNTLKDSLETVVNSENANIQMYEMFLQEDIPNDVKSAFISLKNASRNQLHTFEHVLSKY